MMLNRKETLLTKLIFFLKMKKFIKNTFFFLTDFLKN